MRNTSGLLASLSLLLSSAPAAAQSNDFAGNPTRNGYRVFAGWNFDAGRQFYYDTQYPEPLPNLMGWDYRINLPQVTFQQAALGPGSGAAMVGVIEEVQAPMAATCNESNAGNDTLKCNQHVNNSIWLFRADSFGKVRFAIVPSRRTAGSSAVENTQNLVSYWFEVGPAGSPLFAMEKPAAVAVGQGIGGTTIHVAARGQDGQLYTTSMLLSAANPTSWTTPWTAIGPASGKPSLAVAFTDRVALAWPVSGDIRAALFDPATGAFGASVLAAANGSQAQLLSDGGTLHVMIQGSLADPRYRHARATSAALFGFIGDAAIGSHILNTYCDAISHDSRIHVACGKFDVGGHRVWYSTSLNSTATSWSPPQFVGLDTHNFLQLGALGGEIWIAATTATGDVEYVRKDPHVVPYEYAPTGAARDRWLEVGTMLDPYQVGFISELEMLSFNHDLYLTGTREDGSGSAPGLRVVNFSRAALKRLITSALDIELRWGSAELAEDLSEVADPIETTSGTHLTGDVDGDGDSDLVHVLSGNVRVALWNGSDFDPSTVWRTGFTAPGTLAVADVDGDGNDDLVAASASGSSSTQVSVALARSDGSASFSSLLTSNQSADFPIHAFVVGDVSGDGRADVVGLERTSTGGRIAVARGSQRTVGGTIFASLGSLNSWGSDGLRTGWSAQLADSNGDGTKDLFLLARITDATGFIWTYRLNSTGTAFGLRTSYGRDFAPTGETIRTLDLDLDGKEELVSFTGGTPTESGRVTSLLGRALGVRMPVMVHSGVRPVGSAAMVGRLTPITLAQGVGTFLPAFLFRTSNGEISHADGGRNFALVAGAPWERYRFFTEKGLGVTMFPQWLIDGGCVRPEHRFHLRGASGVGGLNNTWLTQRPGSGQGHVLEELGHSIFASCFSGSSDPFGLMNDIYSLSIGSGGFEANTMGNSCADGVRLPGVPSFIDCRDPQHYFLSWMKSYRVDGETVRTAVANETNPSRLPHYQAQYAWVRDNWFEGAEFFKDNTRREARLETLGLSCLPSLCQ